MNLNINTVTQKEYPEFNTIYIRFNVDDFSYELVLRKKTNAYEPDHIRHNGECLFCNLGNSLIKFLCQELEPYKQEIFEKLIEFPSIRLKWLYLEHI